MLIGTLLGYWLLPYLDTQALKVGFGVLIARFAGRELWSLRRASALPQRPAWLTRVITIAAASELVSFSVTPAEGGASGFVIAVAVR